MKKIILAIVLVLLSGAAFSKEALKVGYLPILDHLTLIVSHNRDNDRFQYVDVQPRKFKSWRKMVGALRRNVIDAAFILSPLAMNLHNDGVALQTVLLAHRDGSAITVRKGSGITDAPGLKGKKIAIPDRQSTHLALLSKYLIDSGLSLKDVSTTVIAPLNMEKAMAKGAIDAFIVAEPFGAKAQASGVGEILVMTRDIIKGHVECIVVVRSEVISNNRKGVQEWVDSLIRSGRFIDRDKDFNGSGVIAGIAAEKRYMGHKESITVNGLQNPRDRISFSSLKPTREEFQPIVEISIGAGILKNINLDEFIDDSFYREIPVSP